MLSADTTLAQAVALLNVTDPKVLTLIGHDERKRLASALRLWAYMADEADRLVWAGALVDRVIVGLKHPRSGVLADLARGERAP